MDLKKFDEGSYSGGPSKSKSAPAAKSR